MGTKTENTGGVFLVSLLIPLVGIVLWAVWNESQPEKARAAIRGAIFGILFLIVIYVVVFMGMMASLDSSVPDYDYLLDY